MFRLLLICSMLSIISCASMMEEIGKAPVRAAWIEEPEGARAAFIRCMYEVAKTQCGSSDLKDPVIEKCIQMQVAEYREVSDESEGSSLSDIKEDKARWLTARGCGVKRAILREGEI